MVAKKANYIIERGDYPMHIAPRKSNIELLRIISMLMVILSHYYCHGAFPQDGFMSINKILMQFLGTGGKIAVDIFVIISGYFLINQKFSLLKICKFLSCTYFWSIVILVFAILTFGLHNLNPVLVKKSLFPLTPLNWFARAYLHLYIIFPLLNIFLHRAGKKQIISIILTLTGFFYVIPTLMNESKGGYLNSFFMFADMYMIGAYIQLYGNSKLIRSLKIGGMFGIATIFSSILVFDYMSLSNPFYRAYDNVMSFSSSGANLFVLLAALGIFVYFNEKKIMFNQKINTIATTTFAIYLIHDNAFVSDWLWNSIVKGYEFYKSDFLVIHMLLSSIAIFAVCSILEYLRIRYFEKPFMCFLKKHMN